MRISDTTTDEELIQKVREEDRELYGEVIRRYQTKLRHYLRKFFRDPDELEDALQEIFIRAYRNLYDFNINRRFAPWIYRVAHNEAINQIKKKSSRYAISLEEHEIDVLDKSLSVGEQMDAGKVSQQLGEALSQLKDKYREPLILHYFEDRSYEEIADIMRLPVGTVGTLLSRGKQRLKEIIKKSYDNQ